MLQNGCLDLFIQLNNPLQSRGCLSRIDSPAAQNAAKDNLAELSKRQSGTLNARQPSSLDRVPVVSKARKWGRSLNACVVIGVGPREPDGQNTGNQVIVLPDHGLLQREDVHVGVEMPRR